MTSLDTSRFQKSDWIVYWHDVDTKKTGDMLLKAFCGQSVKIIQIQLETSFELSIGWLQVSA
jgi:hypothetical protein